MPFIDPEASRLIREMREERGLSPEALADEIRTMAHKLGPEWTRGTVDAFTIRRIEGKPELDRQGFVPGIRVQFVVARYFGMSHTEIWKPNRKVKVISERKARVPA